MATAPELQIAVNSNKVQIFWEVDVEQYYPFWNLYWGEDSSMAPEVLAKGNIPNIADTYYSKHHVTVTINRPTTEQTPFYIRIKGILASGAEDTAHPSATEYVPEFREVDPMLKQKMYGYDLDTGDGIWRPVKVEKDTDPSIAGVLDVTP